MTIEAVLTHAYDLQEKFGIRFDKDGVRLSVEDIAGAVGANLDEEAIIRACDAILAQQEAEFPMYAGLPVISVSGESDSDDRDQERFTGEMAVGVLTQRDDKNAQWCVLFTNGTTVWITDEELADTSQYMVRRHDDLSFLSSKRPDGRDWGAETNEWSASMDFRGEPPNAQGINYFVNIEATAGDDFEADNINSKAHGDIEVGYLVSVDDGSVEIARGTIAHEGDRTDLLGHIKAHQDSILSDVFEAMCHPGKAADNTETPAEKLERVQRAAEEQCNKLLAQAGLPTYQELMIAVEVARGALHEVITTPAGAAVRAREVNARAWTALHGCILSDERKQVLARAQEIAAEKQVGPIRSYEDAVRTFGFSILRDPAITHPRLRTFIEAKKEPTPQVRQASSADKDRLLQAVADVVHAFQAVNENSRNGTFNQLEVSITALRFHARSCGLKSNRFQVAGAERLGAGVTAPDIPSVLADAINRVLDGDMVAASNGGGAFKRHVIPELKTLESLAIGHGLVKFVTTKDVAAAPAKVEPVKAEPKAYRPRM